MKKLFKIILLSFVPMMLLAACDNNSAEREKAAGEKVEGTVQSTVGKLTGNDEMKNEGNVTRTKGDLRSTKEDVKDAVTGN